jgi:hypothetical protein
LIVAPNAALSVAPKISYSCIAMLQMNGTAIISQPMKLNSAAPPRSPVLPENSRLEWKCPPMWGSLISFGLWPQNSVSRKQRTAVAETRFEYDQYAKR